MKSFPAILAAAALLLPLAAHAQFTFEQDQPSFKVTIPSFPPMKMEAHPMNAKSPHLRSLGTEGGFAVSILTPTADAAMKASDCADTLIRVLHRRPGVPPQNRIQKARIDANTFIAVYASSPQELHAHLFSAAGGTHCVEVHATRMNPSESEFSTWLRSFVSARIEPR